MQRTVHPFTLKTSHVDATATDGRADLIFEGYGSVFGGVDSYADTVAPGAFQATLRKARTSGPMPKMLLQHGGGLFGGGAMDMVPIGAWDEMAEDKTGLFVRGRIFDTGTDRSTDTMAAMRRGALSGLSIGFNTKQSTLDVDTGIRTLTEIDLWEVSAVTFPADSAALMTGVKADADLPTEREFERFLRDVGFSQRQAKIIGSRGYRAVKRDVSTPSECNELVDLISQGTKVFTGGS